MAFTEWQQSEIKTAADKYLGRRNEMIDEHLDQVKCEYKIEGQSEIIYEHRKQFQGDGYIDMEIAKATYRKTSNDWKLFWMPSDLKWHGYEQDMIHEDIFSVFKCIDEDECCAFWG